MKEKAKIMDVKQIGTILTRIAHEILEKHKSTESLAIVGIRTRGACLAQRLVENIKKIDGVEVPLGILDITFYRDDLQRMKSQPVVRRTEIPFDITDKDIVLVDDVLFTGRTIRAAMDALMDFGRPHRIQLAILVDRGHRELPIRPDYVGKNVPTSMKESVKIHLKETDGIEEVVMYG